MKTTRTAKTTLLLTLTLLCGVWLKAQQPLPESAYLYLRDSTNAMDIVLMQGKAGSLSLDGRNVQLLNNFFENKTAPKTNAPLGGTIMWLRNGREFITGNFYLGDTTGYVVFNKDGKEYVNRINQQGNAFFYNQMRKE